MSTVISNIKGLLQVRTGEQHSISGSEMKDLPMIENAWIAIKDEFIEDFGPMDEYDKERFSSYQNIDAQGQFVLPCYVDSHTHIVFADTREGEFVDRINGLTYEEIANRGGGILNSAEKLALQSEEELYESAYKRLDTVMAMGTGAIEIKSGYGLSKEAELKMLRVIKKLKENHPLTIKSTFLGAHAIPKEFIGNKGGYMDLVINEILPAVAQETLADYVDIFCEDGYFSVEDTNRLLEASLKYGIKAKTHVNQFNAIGGVEASVKHGAVSVDHLEELKDDDLESLLNSNTIPVALPSCSFFLSIPYTPARKIIDAGLPLALATDFNPGSTPSGNMNFVVSLACIKMGMNPEEAINASTINGAAALELHNELGSIQKGHRANLMITKAIKSYAIIPYSFGENLIDRVLINGKLQL